MRFLPIVERELRVAARRPGTYVARTLGATAALAATGYFFWLYSHLPGRNGAGREALFTLMHIAFLYVLFAGGAITADCVSREKREGTLGLLFLTHLKSYDILLGKLLATSLRTVGGLAASVPALSMCLVLGGVQAGEFWRSVLAVFNALFFSLSIGLLVSSICRLERRSAQTTSTLLVLFGIAFPSLGEYLRLQTNATELGQLLKALSPFQAIQLSAIPTSSVRFYWISLAAVHALGWASLFLACWILPRARQDQSPAIKTHFWKAWWHARLMGNPTQRMAFRGRLLAINPFYWLAARLPQVVVETWVTFGTIVLIATWVAFKYHTVVPLFVTCLITAIILHSIVKMQLCAAACERFSEDKQSGTLEMVLATPLTVREILRGQWHALARQFTPAALAVTVLDLIMFGVVLAAHEPDFFSSPAAPRNCLLILVAGIVTLLADAIALGWVGMWQALTSQQLMQARSKSLFFILLLPWTVLFVGFTIIAVYGSVPAMGYGPELLIGIWFAVGMLNSFFFAFIARRLLHRHFRQLATQRFQPLSRDGSWWRPFLPGFNSRKATAMSPAP